MARMIRKMKKGGFTLIELLIVVAIIGVLSTIGVPTFRRMVQKSKKSEAKVALGGIFTVESAFYSEYGGYGNNLAKVGFEQDGNRQIYRVGFFPTASDCTPVDGSTPANILPDSTTAIGTGLNTAFPQYYTAGTFLSSFGRTNTAGDVCLGGATYNVTPTADGYHVSATGAIAPGITPASAITSQDTWSIDQTRALINVNDGVL